jgi:hypothetical protein
MFQVQIIIIIDIVKTHDLRSCLQKLPDKMKTDEAGGAGHQDLFSG